MKPLQGVRVLDFSRLLPGPLASKLLMDYGAEVTKIEKRGNGDWLKYFESNDGQESRYYKLLNDGKSVFTFDFNSDDDRQQIFELIKTADVLIEQFRPGTMQQFGFGYDVCRKVNGTLIYISLTGFGQTGPLKAQAGHDLNYLAESGILSLMQDINGRPIVPGIQIADIAGGSMGVVNACLAGLLERLRTGEGCYIDVSITSNLKVFLAAATHGRSLRGEKTFLTGGLVNYNVYATADNQWVAFAALEMKFWNNFCDLVLRPDWKRETLEELKINRFPLHEIEALFAAKPLSHWIEFGQQDDICISPVRALQPVIREKMTIL